MSGEKKDAISDEGKNEGHAPKFDPESFKNEIKEQTKAITDSLAEVVSAKLDSIEKRNTVETVTDKAEALSEFADEIEEMGIDETQGKAMLRMFEKFLGKKTGSFKQEVLEEVEGRQATKETKVSYTNEAKNKFPQVLDHSSALFKESQKIYKTMSSEAKGAPDAELIAIERAAYRLGIQPVDISRAYSASAENPTGSGAATKVKEKEVSSEFASLFNVDPKKVNEKYKSILKH